MQSLSTELRETIEVFDAGGAPLTTSEVAADLDLGRRTAYARLERLVEADRLSTKKVGASARVWWRAADPSPPLLSDLAGRDDEGVLLVDGDGSVAWANDAFERYVGLTDADVVGRDADAFFEETLAAAVADPEALVAARADGGDAGECRITAGPNRRERLVEHSSQPVRAGEMAGGHVHRFEDVTERTGGKQGHWHRCTQFQSLVDAVEEYAIFTLDTEGYIQTWNTGAERIKGYEAEEILGEHFSAFYTGADREAGVPTENLAAAREAGEIDAKGWRLRADGSRFWASVTISAIRDDEGELQGFVKVTRDVTGSKRARAERELLFDTMQSLAGAESFEAGLQDALADICRVTDWEYAEAWVPSAEGDLRRADADYHVAELADFAALSSASRFDPGEGLPGRVFDAEATEWLADLSTASATDFCRLEAAQAAGLQSSLGVPVVADGEVVAVLTFLMRDRRQRDERLVNLVASVAAGLGDLVARRRAEERVDRQRELLAHIFETAPTALAVLDAEGELLRANDRLADVFGLSPSELSSYTAGDHPVLGPDGDPLPFEERPVGRVLQREGPVLDQQVQLERPDGSTVWLSVNATALTDADGDLDRVVVAARDVSQLKSQAADLEQQRDHLEAELQEVLGRVDDGFFALDDDWEVTHINDRAASMLEREPADLVGQNLWDAFPEAADTAFRRQYERALVDQETVTFEEYYPPLDTWFEVTVYPSESGLSVYFRDVTGRKARERELEQYERVVETVADGIYVLNEGGLFQQVNESFVEMTRFDREELLGSHASVVFGDDFEEIEAEATRSFTDDGDDVAVFEEEIQTAADRTITVESRFSQFEIGGGQGRAGVIRDITDRIERQKELELYATIIETVPDGVYALDDDDKFVLVNEAFCDLVEYEREDLIGAHPTLVNSTEMNRRANEQERAVSDGEQSTGTLQMEMQTASGDAVPVEGHFSPYSYRDLSGRCGVARDISERVERERRLERQRAQLTALNNLNQVIREITEGIIEQSTREEIERTVCGHLADSESYLFAWVGDADPGDQSVNLRAEAGVEGYLDGITISVDPDDDCSSGPTGRAFRTGEVQTTDHVQSDPRYEPWHDHAREYGYRSSAAIPIVHEGTVYGVLNVYSDRKNAFRGAELEMVSQLGEIVGHAIGAVERKQALLSDEVVELGFQVEQFVSAMDIDTTVEGRIELEHVVPVGDDEFVLFGRTTPGATGVLREMVEQVPVYESVSFRDDGERFQLTVSEPPVLSAVASLGGSVEEAVIEDGDYRIVVHLSPSADVGQFIDTVLEAYPRATLLKRRQLSKREPDDTGAGFVSDLTERQRTALETAYYAGFFEWPRAASGEAVADSLGVAAPTFHQHLRKAERKVFDRVFAAVD